MVSQQVLQLLQHTQANIPPLTAVPPVRYPSVHVVITVRIACNKIYVTNYDYMYTIHGSEIHDHTYSYLHAIREGSIKKLR